MKSKLFDFPGPRFCQPLTFKYVSESYIQESNSGYIGHFILDVDQYRFSKYLEGLVSKEYLEKFKVDTLNLYRGRTKSFVSVQVINEGKKKVIIVDNDNDLDFTNNERHSYSTTDSILFKKEYAYSRYPSIKVSFERTINSKIFTQTKYIQIKPFDTGWSFKEKIDFHRQVFVSNGQVKQGFFNYQGNTYEILIAFGGGNLQESLDFSFIYVNGILEPYDIKGWIRTGTKGGKSTQSFTIKPLNLKDEILQLSIIPKSPYKAIKYE